MLFPILRRRAALAAFLALVPQYLQADRVTATFDPSTAGLSLKFDTNSVASDNYFSPNVVFSADGSKGFVNFPGSDSVVVFDAATTSLLATLPVGKNPALLALTPDGKTLAVANVHLADKIPVNKQLGSVSLIDVASLSVRTVSFPKVDFGLASNIVFSPDSSIGYLSSTGTDELIRFRVPEGTEITPRLKLPDGSRPVQLTVSADGSLLAVVNVADQQFSTLRDSVSIVETAGFRLRTTITPKETHDFQANHNVALTRDGRRGIIGDALSETESGLDVVYIFDTTSGEVLKRLEVGIAPSFATVTPDGTRFAVLSRTDIALISTDSMELVSQVVPDAAVFAPSANLVFAPGSSTVFIPGILEDVVYAIDLATSTVTDRIPVGKNPATAEDGPSFVALAPADARVAVLNFGSNSVDFVARTFSLGLPRFYANGLRFTALVLANVGASPANVSLQAFSTVGTVFADFPTTEKVEVRNPVTLELAAGQQSVNTGDALFGVDTTVDPIDGWISLDSTSPHVIGAAVIGDYGKRLNVVNLTRERSTTFVVPVIRQNANFSTDLVISNPNFNTASITVDLFDAEGTLVVSTPVSAYGGSVVTGLLASSDPAVASLIPEAADLVGAYIVVKSSVPVQMMVLYETVDAIGILPAAGSSADADVAQFTVPVVSYGGGVNTVVTLLNRRSQDLETVWTLVGGDGRPHSERTVPIGAGRTSINDVAELFGLPIETLASAWLRITFPRPGSGETELPGPVVGAAEVFGPEGIYSIFPLTPDSGTDFYFATLAQGDGFQTAMALVNPGVLPASVTLELYNSEGTVVARHTLQLEAGTQRIETLPSLFGVEAADSRIRVRSSAPVAALEFFSNAAPLTLSVVLPQAAP